MRRKRYMALGLCVVTAATLLTGCGGSNSDGKANTEAVTEVATEKATEAATEAATEKATEVATEKVTEAATEAVTEEATETATEKETEESVEASFPIVDEKITLTAYGQKDQNHAPWKDMKVFQRYEELSNIHMDFQEVPADGYSENKQLLFASNDLPDVFLRGGLTANEISTYGVGSGQLMILDDLIDQYAPNIKKIFDEYPSIRQTCTASDGHIYAIPTVDISATGKMDFKQWINTAWLEKLGLEIPTTLDEFKEVLIAFRDKDPNGNGENDEIPLGIRDPNSIYQLGGAFGLGYQMKDTYDIEDGKVHNWLCDDKFKDYLVYLNDLYSEKLIWQEYYKNDRPSWRSNLSGELFGAMYMPYSDVFLNCEQDYTGYEPLIGPTGEKYWPDAKTGADIGAYAISNTCSNPEAAMRWVDYFYSDEGALFFIFGKEGEEYTLVDGKPVLKDEILNAEEGFMTALGKITMVPGLGFPSMLTDETDSVLASQRTKDAAKILEPYLPEIAYAKPAVSPEDMDRVVAIEQDLVTYRDEAVTKFIVGEWDFDMWDEYCDTLEKIGIRELEEIYQRALDAQ